MRLIAVGILVILLGGCQGGGLAPIASGIAAALPTPDAESTDEDIPETGAVKGFDGTITYSRGGNNNLPPERLEYQSDVIIQVHLVSKPNTFDYADAGSTFSYVGSTLQYSPEKLGSCGIDQTSKGSGGGLFAAPMRIAANYYTPTGHATLSVRVQYTEDVTRTYICLGKPETSKGPAGESLTCGDSADSWLVGKILPGDVIDFECSQKFMTGTGGTTVHGTLTGH